MPWSIADYLLEHRLWWLDHLGHMGNDHIPKKLLFGELVKSVHSMDLRKGGVVKLWVICVPLVLRMVGTSYARIVRSGQSCIPALLMFST